MRAVGQRGSHSGGTWVSSLGEEPSRCRNWGAVRHWSRTSEGSRASPVQIPDVPDAASYAALFIVGEKTT